ncbi:MAG: UDP-3-O-(3-hydroxymyristoyl)glucosamine N-acyltransferase [Vicinamibacteria bacterium]|nr:UDP-3-O-(3-hydroxymyristoyl)glucosamine N-acyltransferase [Vicinamibacteria bacterium]
MRLDALAARLGCALRGDGSVDVARVAGLDQAGPGDITFLANPRYADKLDATRASAVIVRAEVATALPALLSDNPYLSFAQALEVLHPQPRPAPGVHPAACVDPTATLGADVHVGPLAVIGAGCSVGPRSVIHPHVVLYAGVTVGADCVLHSGAQVRERCRLGDRVVLQNNAVIGADGFGFAPDGGGRYQKIPQVGIVVLEDDVEIGALTAVDRAALSETRIGRGSKLDNLIQIGHSVTVGEDTVMAAQVGIAGSTKVGSRVRLAGQVGVGGHLTIGDGVTATGQTGITSSPEAGAVVSGTPMQKNRDWLRSSLLFARLPELVSRLRAVEKKLGA